MSSRAMAAGLLSILALAACGERRSPAEAGKVETPAASAPATPAPKPSTPAAPERDTLIEPSRDLGGVLPLKHGIFVSADVACGEPPNAALRRYDGQGLSGAHTHACEMKVVGQRGSSYDIEQSCIDAGQGPAPRSIEKATIDIQDNLTFTLKRGGAGETFRYCAASLLPPGLRTW
jgi:hypothetical protein